MRLGAPHDDALVALVDDVQVQVGVGLLVRRLAAVALHVGLRDRDREVVVAAALVERHEAFELDVLQHGLQREQRVGADVLQRDQRPAERGRRLDEPHAGEEVVGAARDPVVRAVLSPTSGSSTTATSRYSGSWPISKSTRSGRPRRADRVRRARRRRACRGTTAPGRPGANSRYSSAVRRAIPSPVARVFDRLNLTAPSSR